MTNKEALICDSCGGRIDRDRMICPYCGTAYKKDEYGMVRIETFQNPVKTYKSSCEIPDCYAKNDPDKISECAVNELAHNLASAIKESMDIAHTYDPDGMVHRINARIRIVEPKYLF